VVSYLTVTGFAEGADKITLKIRGAIPLSPSSLLAELIDNVGSCAAASGVAAVTRPKSSARKRIVLGRHQD
jgi:hypothetical protein